MLTVKTESVARAMMRLKTAPEFEPIKAYLSEQFNAEALRLIQMRDSQQIGRIQGRAEMLHDLLELLESSPETLQFLEKIRS